MGQLVYAPEMSDVDAFSVHNDHGFGSVDGDSSGGSKSGSGLLGWVASGAAVLGLAAVGYVVYNAITEEDELDEEAAVGGKRKVAVGTQGKAKSGMKGGFLKSEGSSKKIPSSDTADKSDTKGTPKKAPNKKAHVGFAEMPQAELKALVDADTDPDAICEFGRRLLFPGDGPNNLPEARRRFQDAAWRGSAKGLAYLAVMEAKGSGGAKDEEAAEAHAKKARSGLKAAGEAGDAEAYNALGRLYFYQILSAKASDTHRKKFPGQPHRAQAFANQCVAVKFFRASAELGYIKGQHNLGLCYDIGEGVDQNAKMAAKYYKMAADQGDIQSMKWLGLKYSGLHQEDPRLPAEARWVPDKAKAYEFMQRAADAGNGEALCHLATFVDEGIGCRRDASEVERLLLQAAEERNMSTGYHELGERYLMGGRGSRSGSAASTGQNKESSGADKDDKNEETQQEEDDGSRPWPRDVEKAKDYFEKSISLGTEGCVKSMVSMGLIHMNVIGTMLKDAAAAESADKEEEAESEGGDSASKDEAGDEKKGDDDDELSFQADYRKAEEYLKMAQARGHGPPYYYLWSLYSLEDCPEEMRDDAKAYLLFSEACAFDSVKAQSLYALGRCHHLGKGVPGGQANPQQAYQLFRLAAQLGDARAVRLLQENDRRAKEAAQEAEAKKQAAAATPVVVEDESTETATAPEAPSSSESADKDDTKANTEGSTPANTSSGIRADAPAFVPSTAAASASPAAPAEPAAEEEEEEFKGQYYTAPPPAKTEAEKEAARKKILEEADELDMFGDGGDFAGAEDSDEEEPEANAHLKNDPYATAASRVEASASKD